MGLGKIFKNFKGKIFKRKNSEPAGETPEETSYLETKPLMLDNNTHKDNEATTPVMQNGECTSDHIITDIKLDPDQEKILNNAVNTLKNVVQSVNPVRNFVSMITGKKISLNNKANSSLVRAANFFKTKFKSGEISSIKTNTDNLKTSVNHLYVLVKDLYDFVVKHKIINVMNALNNFKSYSEDINRFVSDAHQFNPQKNLSTTYEIIDADLDYQNEKGDIKDRIDEIKASTQQVKKALKLTTRIYNKFDIKANSIKESIKRGLHLTKDE